MTRIVYHTNGDGVWQKITYAEQCDKKRLFNKCQGVKGHSYKYCWHYDTRGSYVSSGPGGGFSMTPPGHKNYVNPVDRYADYYMHHRKIEELTDPAEIARIEAGKILSHESINRPII